MSTNLKSQRQEIGISQIELSMAARVPKYKIQLAEKGIPCLSLIEASQIVAKLGNYKELPTWIIHLIEQETES
jgi:hypothetical protein